MLSFVSLNQIFLLSLHEISTFICVTYQKSMLMAEP